MSEEQDNLERLAQDIFATQSNEIQCEAAATLIARCAAALLADEEAQRQYPQLWRHFRFCSNCAEEYAMALELARLEAAGQWEQPDDAPPLPGGGSTPVWSWARDAIMGLFPGFTPEVAAAVRRGQDWGFEPVEVNFDRDNLQFEFDVAVSEADNHLRNLFCTISTPDEALKAHFEGASVWLQADDEGPAVQEQMLDELGDVTFSHLPPGRYALRLHLARREYGVTGILLP
jgi:hypothetical protein